MRQSKQRIVDESARALRSFDNVLDRRAAGRRGLWMESPIRSWFLSSLKKGCLMPSGKEVPRGHNLFWVARLF